MSFSSTWLELREPADRAARDSALLARARQWLQGIPTPVAVDLGCGLGSTARAIDLDVVRWRLVDNDPELLREACRRVPGARPVDADLADPASLPFDGARLVTASALFDLCGAAVIDGIADAVSTHGAALYAALSYDGVMTWEPPDADYHAVVEAFNRHQRQDKGLGTALGPDAARYLVSAMERRGYRVQVAQSPWRLGAASSAMQHELLDGIAAAASEAGVDAGSWRARRHQAIEASICIVGHLDVLALPA